ncbi:hypothetical protein ACG33_07545 [Steroidobacter denitrificans]|uniref:Uncharacterized protein n=1 Tax=Steroidobacter denitrificans TaxID=465721 RepID=A0A127F959_STEDE|nr:hypothetical protein [Steroidobacter denitrificans]AMN46952.1 hypothetical protein ACG33_07545 [Steroidobacter denitrificans]
MSAFPRLSTAAATLLLTLGALAANAQTASCDSSALLYSAKDYAALQDRMQRRDFIRAELATIWSEINQNVSWYANLYGVADYGNALGVPKAEAIERALALSATQRLQALQGRPFNAQRVNRVLSDMKTGRNFGARMAQALNAASVGVDTVNLFYNMSNALQSGDRAAKVATLSSSMSLGRAWLAANWEAAMGPMMGMVGVLDYSLNAFGESAWARYEDYFWNGYRNYTRRRWKLDPKDWLDVWVNEGQAGIDRRLADFWNDPDGLGVDYLVYEYRQPGTAENFIPIARSGYAVAEYRKAFAARYMIELIEPLLAQALHEQAQEAMFAAMDEFAKHCSYGLAEAEAIEAAYLLLEANPGPTFKTASCPAPMPFQPGVDGQIAKDVDDKRLRALRSDLNVLAASEGYDLSRLEHTFKANLNKRGLLTDVASEFSTRELAPRTVVSAHASGIDVLIPPALLMSVWSGEPTSLTGSFRTAYIAFGKALAQLAPEILGDHFGSVRVITRFEDADSPLILNLTGFDLSYRHRLGVWRGGVSGVGKLGIAVCFEGKNIHQGELQTEESEIYRTIKSVTLHFSDVVALMASDVVRQALDLAAEQVNVQSDERLHEFLATTAGERGSSIGAIEVTGLPNKDTSMREDSVRQFIFAIEETIDDVAQPHD